MFMQFIKDELSISQLHLKETQCVKCAIMKACCKSSTFCGLMLIIAKYQKLWFYNLTDSVCGFITPMP